MTYLYVFVAFLIFFVMFVFLMQPWLDGKKNILKLLVFGVILLTVNVGLIWHNTELFIRFHVLTTYFPAFLYCYKDSEYKGFRAVFTFLSNMLFTVLIFTTSYVIGGIGGYKVTLDIGVRIILCTLICIFIKKIYAPWYYFAIENVKKGWGLLCGINLALMLAEYCLLFLNVDAGRKDYWLPAILVMGIIVLYYVMLVKIFRQISEQFQLKHQREFLVAQEMALKQQLTLEEEMQQRVRMLSHDMRHYGNTIIGLLEEGEVQKAREVADYFVDAVEECREQKK